MTSLAFERTLSAQRTAADPATSAFVSANAGSGKTRVLTNRVARLLLAGAPPDRILCITFTRAAAAEMSDRLFNLLGEWALMGDDDLRQALHELDPAMTPSFASTDFGRARRLFAQALETPGGLKIQTIHSFCQALLARFPMEAGLAPGFSVLEEADEARMKREAVNAVAANAAAQPDGEIAAAINRLGQRGAGGGASSGHGRKPSGVRDVVEAALGAPAFRDALTDPDYARKLLDRLGESAARAPDDIYRQIIDAISPVDMARLAEALRNGKKTAVERGEALADFEKKIGWRQRLAVLEAAFAIKSGEWADKFIDADAKKFDQGSDAIATRLKADLKLMTEMRRGAQTFADACALALVVRAASHEYETAKASGAHLDFDDLIHHAQNLLADKERAAWVMYKLDQGLEHILLDEAQDTSPAAWRVIEAPLGEFFVGAGQDRKSNLARTFFAVGDKKQSIYSFQGADAQLFNEKLVDLGKKIEGAGANFQSVDLTLSFRTTAPILAFVDAIFVDRAARQGLTDDLDLRHEPYRQAEPGLVEIWPLTPAIEEPEYEPWDAPLDAMTTASRERRLALAVAEKVTALLAGADTPDGSGGRRDLRPSDVMILVQSRGPVFAETIRALTAAGVPTAGADVLDLVDDQGVLDLMAFARAAISDADDLALAEVLKSPLFGANDELLFKIAYGRKGTLRRALKDACENGFAPEEWTVRFETARAIGRREGPFAFLTHVLDAGMPTGRARLLGRLGAPAREPIEALVGQAIAYERTEARSLRGFVSWIGARGAKVKREADQADDVVKVTTVHKAKGQEAPIVFVLETNKKPRLRHDRLPLSGGAANAPVDLPTPEKANMNELIDKAKTSADVLAYDEYRRLLYVAATRARDRLYLCGVAPKNGTSHDGDPARQTWDAHARGAFDVLKSRPGESSLSENAGRLWDLPILRFGSPTLVKEPDAATDANRPSTMSICQQAKTAPAFLFASPAPERPPLRLSPTRLADLAEAVDDKATEVELGYRPGGDSEALLRGQTIHALLEVLPAVAPTERAAAANRLAARLAPSMAVATQRLWAQEALAVVEAPAFTDAFGPAARAEAGIAGELDGPSGPVRVSGRVDRLVVTRDRVLVIDYKTNRPPPKEAQNAASAYLVQMGAYVALLKKAFPGRTVSAALVWTYEARLMPLPEELITAALEQALARTR